MTSNPFIRSDGHSLATLINTGNGSQSQNVFLMVIEIDTTTAIRVEQVYSTLHNLGQQRSDIEFCCNVQHARMKCG